MSRLRLLLVLALTLLVSGGVSTAFAQEAPPPAPSEAPGDPDCSAEACGEPAEDPQPEETEAAETEPSEPVTEDDTAEVPVTEEPVEEEPAEERAKAAPAADPEVRASAESTANRAALAFADAAIDIVDFDYNPGSVTIKAGETVTWTQSGEEPHTVTADDGTFDSGQLATGETFSMRFDSPGTYPYFCTLHGGPGGEGMAAVVIVEGGQASDDPPSVDPEGEDEGDGNGENEPEAEKTPAAPANDGSLPRTGGGPPAAWIFALALVLSGFVLAKVARLSQRAERL